MKNLDGWKASHFAALSQPRPGFEAAISGGFYAWAAYADGHRARYDAPIGDDGVLGPQWAAWGSALIGLLNGETGRLDCGWLDGEIRRLARNNEWKAEL